MKTFPNYKTSPACSRTMAVVDWLKKHDILHAFDSSTSNGKFYTKLSAHLWLVCFMSVFLRMREDDGEGLENVHPKNFHYFCPHNYLKPEAAELKLDDVEETSVIYLATLSARCSFAQRYEK